VGGGGGNSSPDVNPPANPSNNILSSYLTQTFPPFDDTPYRDKVTSSSRQADYIMSQSDAQNFYDTSINEKSFRIDGGEFGDDRFHLIPNFDYESLGIRDLSVGFYKLEHYWDEASSVVAGDYVIDLHVEKEDNIPNEAYFDEIFGHLSGIPDWEYFTVEYNVGMVDEVAAYCAKIQESGIVYGEDRWEIYDGSNNGAIGCSGAHWDGNGVYGVKYEFNIKANQEGTHLYFLKYQYIQYAT
jgi:hypothetical protein